MPTRRLRARARTGWLRRRCQSRKSCRSRSPRRGRRQRRGEARRWWPRGTSYTRSTSFFETSRVGSYSQLGSIYTQARKAHLFSLAMVPCGINLRETVLRSIRGCEQQSIPVARGIDSTRNKNRSGTPRVHPTFVGCVIHSPPARAGAAHRTPRPVHRVGPDEREQEADAADDARPRHLPLSCRQGASCRSTAPMCTTPTGGSRRSSTSTRTTAAARCR